jgi:hypothetical protein
MKFAALQFNAEKRHRLAGGVGFPNGFVSHIAWQNDGENWKTQHFADKEFEEIENVFLENRQIFFYLLTRVA